MAEHVGRQGEKNALGRMDNYTCLGIYLDKKPTVTGIARSKIGLVAIIVFSALFCLLMLLLIRTSFKSGSEEQVFDEPAIEESSEMTPEPNIDEGIIDGHTEADINTVKNSDENTISNEIAASDEQNDVDFEKYKEAAMQGDAEAQYNLAVMYYEGIGTEKDDEAAIRWARQAAAQGYSEAIKLLREIKGEQADETVQ